MLHMLPLQKKFSLPEYDLGQNKLIFFHDLEYLPFTHCKVLMVIDWILNVTFLTNIHFSLLDENSLMILILLLCFFKPYLTMIVYNNQISKN